MTLPLPPATGLIDMHSHLLPGIDDGCVDLDESLDSIATLKAHGYVGSICTPHVWPQMFPEIDIPRIAIHVEALRQQLAQRHIDYHLWAGAELRLHKHVVAQLKHQGVPTLAETNRVLCDVWCDKWPAWLGKVLDWLLSQGYQPILAHPERINIDRGLEEKLTKLTDAGVWLQGNFQAFTGELGYLPDRYVRQFMEEERYTFLALDMHRPVALPGRLDGLTLAQETFGPQRVRDMTDAALRDKLFGWD